MPNNPCFGAPDGDQALDGPTRAETKRHMQGIAGVILGDLYGLIPLRPCLISWFGLKNDVGLLA